MEKQVIKIQVKSYDEIKDALVEELFKTVNYLKTMREVIKQ